MTSFHSTILVTNELPDLFIGGVDSDIPLIRFESVQVQLPDDMTPTQQANWFRSLATAADALADDIEDEVTA